MPPLRLVHLYPDLMSVYGDRGNVLALARRAEWRGIELQVQELTLGDRLDPDEADLIFFGGGQDREQAVVSPDFLAQKGQAVREAVEQGAALLSVCGGYQLLGRSYTTVDGQELPGGALFDVRSVPGPKRHIGNVLIETDLDGQRRTLVGFENHSGRTYLGTGLQPLGRTVVGAGNNGEDRSEGAVYKNAIGCYLHGSLLPKNPWLADRLLSAALRHRTGEPGLLAPLDDRIEDEAHAAVEAQIRANHGRVKSGLW
ncbi:MAG TPA: glutamine amidotransferase [Chloroflexota bacterium]|nr:glutamine amidotransferase [Chloroflexota bacterium]